MLDFNKTTVDFLICTAFAGYNVSSADKDDASQQPLTTFDYCKKSIAGVVAAKCFMYFPPVIASTIKSLVDYRIDSYLGQFSINEGLANLFTQFKTYIALSENYQLIVSQLLNFFITPYTLLSNTGYAGPITFVLIVGLFVWLCNKQQNEQKKMTAIFFGIVYAGIINFCDPFYTYLLLFGFINHTSEKNCINAKNKPCLFQTNSEQTIPKEPGKVLENSNSNCIEKKSDRNDLENLHKKIMAVIDHLPSKEEAILIGEEIYNEKILNIPEDRRSPMDKALKAIIDFRCQDSDFRSLTDVWLKETFDKQTRDALGSFIHFQSDINSSISIKLNSIKNPQPSKKFQPRDLSKPFTREELEEFITNGITKEGLIIFGEKIYYEKISKISSDKRTSEQKVGKAILEKRNKDLEFRSLTDPFIEGFIDKLLFKKIISFIDPKRDLSTANYEGLNNILMSFQTNPDDKKLTLLKIKKFLAFRNSEPATLIDFCLKIFKIKIENALPEPLLKKAVLAIIEARSKDSIFKSAIDLFGMDKGADLIFQKINSFISPPEPEVNIPSNITLFKDIIFGGIKQLLQFPMLETAVQVGMNFGMEYCMEKSPRNNAIQAIFELRNKDASFRSATDRLLACTKEEFGQIL